MTRSLTAALSLGAVVVWAALANLTVRAADSPAEAEQPGPGGLYMRGDAGWSFLDWTDVSDDDALTLGGGIGFYWNDYLRTDATVDWVATDSVDLTTVMGNAYVDLPIHSLLTPYAGAGAGAGWVDSDAGGDDTGFAYSLMLGTAINLSDSLAIDAGYRFRDILIDGDDPSDHSLRAGIRYRF